METHEKALLAVIAEHLQVTTSLLDHYAKLAKAVRNQREIAESLPAFESRPTLQELHASTRALQARVQAIVDSTK